jgi:hypothetical protein
MGVPPVPADPVGEAVAGAPEVATGVPGVAVDTALPVPDADGDDEAGDVGEPPEPEAPDADDPAADDPELAGPHPATSAPATARTAPVSVTLRTHVVVVIPLRPLLADREIPAQARPISGNAPPKTPLGR